MVCFREFVSYCSVGSNEAQLGLQLSLPGSPPGSLHPHCAGQHVKVWHPDAVRSLFAGTLLPAPVSLASCVKVKAQHLGDGHSRCRKDHLLRGRQEMKAIERRNKLKHSKLTYVSHLRIRYDKIIVLSIE